MLTKHFQTDTFETVDSDKSKTNGENKMLKKQTINHFENVERLNAFVRFGFACLMCGMSDIRFLSAEHYTPKCLFGGDKKAADTDNIWTSCVDCNQKKADMLPDAFFVGRYAHLKATIENGLKIPVNAVQRQAMVIIWANKIVESAKMGNAPTVSMIRFLTSLDVRELVGCLDFGDAYIQGNINDIKQLRRYHNLENAEVHVNKTR